VTGRPAELGAAPARPRRGPSWSAGTRAAHRPPRLPPRDLAHPQS